MLPKARLVSTWNEKMCLLQGRDNRTVEVIASTCTTYGGERHSLSFLIDPGGNNQLLLIKSANNLRKAFLLIYIENTETSLKIDLSKNYTISHKNRPWSLNQKNGFFSIYIKKKEYTNNPKKDNVYFVSDVKILLLYVLKRVDENEVFAAAEETAKEISETEKTTTRIKTLKSRLEIATTQVEELQNKLAFTEKCIHGVHKSFKLSNRTWTIREITQKGTISSEAKALLEEILKFHFDLFRQHKFITEMAANAVEIFKTPDNNGWKNLTVETGNPVSKLLFQTKEWKESATAMREAQEKKWVWQRASARTKALSNFPDAQKPENLTSGHRNMKNH